MKHEWTRRLLTVLLCCGMLLSLAACGGGTEPTEAAPEVVETQSVETDPVPVTINTDAESYSVLVGSMVPVVASVEAGEGEEPTFTYVSADESIATVNKYGKVVGVAAGTTEVTITTSNGGEKTVSITVEEPEYADVLRVALNVLYNDATLGCTNTEYGPYVEIYEDGQYTVTFDCTMHLSESSRNMGVTGLNNLTAIFLYDQAVRDGDQKVSSVTAAQIRWDSVTVNGQELTLNNSEFKSAIKASGIFDTNDPLNAWDGSAVEEVIVDTENHVLNIDVEDPVSVTVTFTVQGLTFDE